MIYIISNESKDVYTFTNLVKGLTYNQQMFKFKFKFKFVLFPHFQIQNHTIVTKYNNYIVYKSYTF